MFVLDAHVYLFGLAWVSHAHVGERTNHAHTKEIADGEGGRKRRFPKSGPFRKKLSVADWVLYRSLKELYKLGPANGR